MLELKGIKKDYPAGDTTVHALKGIDLQFRENEFVSILGPSGCGKTTMLNIIGGLDKYSEGDLIINGRSTKSYKDRDWDTYRNHSIGFVFQSYNLIPHQTVLQNVELALTLSGVSKKERRERAVKALEEVGLGSQLKKRPGEMSGGQMQRVAIVRALVNDPDIILADEPTGALDTETSIQVMEILKKVAEKRLIIMVTHNPELAEKYSTRIIRMLDGEIIDDSKPLSEDEISTEREKEQKQSESEKGRKKSSMSWGTSFGLSLKNLFTKKGRTVLTSFAGSIGIIGIALIYAVSQGMTAYINTVQEETLSSYPITIEAEHTDISTIMSAMSGAKESKGNHDMDAVYKATAFYDLMNTINTSAVEKNDLRAFKKYLDEKIADSNGPSKLHDAVSGVHYSYDLDLLVYTENVDGTIIRSDTKELIQDVMSEYMSGASGASNGMNPMMTMSMGSGMKLWQEMLGGENGSKVSELIKKQYELIYGDYPTSYDEIMLVLDENNELADTTLYALGLIPKQDMLDLMQAAFEGTEISNNEQKWSYEEICGMEFITIPNSDCYKYDAGTGTYTDLRESEEGMKALYSGGIPLKVTGIIKPNKDAVSTMLDSGIAYTTDLTKYVIERSSASEAVKAQQNAPDTDILTGLPFKGAADTSGSKDKFPASTYEDNLKKLGCIDLESPSAINIYAASFEDKDVIEDAIKDYNSSVDELHEIKYTDIMGIMMSGITTIINAIAYVLIAFVAISLIVSSIMIGVITLISVQERTKEIGILRAIGASKKNVSSMFNAETIIIGFASGLIGVLITYLLCIPINGIIHAITKINTLSAFLPVSTAVVLIVISCLLTLVSGVIPSRSAAKKDPVVALRSE